MKVAFVVGFYSTVETALGASFKKQLDAKSLVFLGKTYHHHAFDLSLFKSQLLQRADDVDGDPILVIVPNLSSAKGLEWVGGKVDEIVDGGRSRKGGRQIEIVRCDDTQNPDPVLQALGKFQLADSDDTATVAESALTAYTGGKKVMCVRGKGQPEFGDALRRAGFQFSNFDDHFLEVELAHTSNANNTIKKFAKQHDCLLYAWGVLKYLQPAIKDKWQNLHQGDTPAAAVGRFKQAVLGLQAGIARKETEKENTD